MNMKRIFILMIFITGIISFPVFAGNVPLQSKNSETLVESNKTKDGKKVKKDNKKYLNYAIDFTINNFINNENEEEEEEIFLPEQEKVSLTPVLCIFIINLLFVVAFYYIMKLIDKQVKAKKLEKNKKIRLLIKYLDIFFEIFLLHLFPLAILLYARVLIAYFLPLAFTYVMLLAMLRSGRMRY